jgi:hypothetical protein
LSSAQQKSAELFLPIFIIVVIIVVLVLTGAATSTFTAKPSDGAAEQQQQQQQQQQKALYLKIDNGKYVCLSSNRPAPRTSISLCTMDGCLGRIVLIMPTEILSNKSVPLLPMEDPLFVSASCKRNAWPCGNQERCKHIART